MNNEYNQKSIKIGIITVSLAIIANFIPAVYFYFKTGVIPSAADMTKIFLAAATAFGVSWFIQPTTFFSIMGLSGTYIGWLAGNCAGLRAPAITMSQKVSGYEPSTPEGDCMATLGIVASVYLTIIMLTFFTIVGVGIIDSLPPFIKAGFKYILPGVFGAVYTQLCIKQQKVGIVTLVIALAEVALFHALHFPNWILNIVVILTGVVVIRQLVYKKA